MAIGTPNPDFDAEPWCQDGPADAPEVILVQADVSELPPEQPTQQ